MLSAAQSVRRRQVHSAPFGQPHQALIAASVRWRETARSVQRRLYLAGARESTFLAEESRNAGEFHALLEHHRPRLVRRRRWLRDPALPPACARELSCHTAS